MKELQKNDHYKILKIELPAGTGMPQHFATSDAFVMVESGSALLFFKGEKCELRRGSSFSIPANEPHILRVVEDFTALVVMANDAVITYSA